MRLTTSSILVITFILYMGQMENARVLATVPPVDPITAIKTGVELSAKIMKSLKEAIESSTIVKSIKEEMKTIKLVNDYLSEKEKQMVDDAKEELALAENDFNIMRIELTVLAEQTKSKTKKLIKYTNYLSDGGCSPEDSQKFKVIYNRFVTLMKISSTKLKKAVARYETMKTKLTKTRVKLKNFQQSVENLDDKHSKRYTDYKDNLRQKAYLISLSCLNPATIYACPFVYATVATIVETLINDYHNEVQTLKTNCKSIVESVTGLLDQINTKNIELDEEMKLVKKWSFLVDSANEDYVSKSITKVIQEICWFKHVVIDEFQGLYNAADAFNKWMLKMYKF